MLEQGLPAGFKDVSLVNNNLLSWTVRALPVSYTLIAYKLFKIYE